MKKICLVILLFTSLISRAQKIEKFYDYKWELCDPAVARYYTLIKHTDSGWLRYDYFIREKKLQMQGLYKDNACKIEQGSFFYFHANGELESAGRFENGKRLGLWLSYYDNGMMEDSTVYDAGNPVGTSLKWYRNGYPSDSSVQKAGGMTVFVRWFDNGQPSSAGFTLNGKLHGKWQYFHRNGKLSAFEEYDNGRLLSRDYYDESGIMMSDTSNKDRPALFPGGQKAWSKYILSQLYFPSQYQITGGDQATVVISATIDEDGKVTDIEVVAPFYPAFDDIAVKMMERSPKWMPAMDHNRRVKYYIKQPVTFAQETD
jgi:TonB family protein